MAKRPARPAESTLGDLLRDVVEGRRFTAWCNDAGLRPQTVARLIDGAVVRPHRGTISLLAKALGVDAARVRAAIEASRAAKG